MLTRQRFGKWNGQRKSTRRVRKGWSLTARRHQGNSTPCQKERRKAIIHNRHHYSWSLLHRQQREKTPTGKINKILQCIIGLSLEIYGNNNVPLNVLLVFSTQVHFFLKAAVKWRKRLLSNRGGHVLTAPSPTVTHPPTPSISIPPGSLWSCPHPSLPNSYSSTNSFHQYPTRQPLVMSSPLPPQQLLIHQLLPSVSHQAAFGVVSLGMKSGSHDFSPGWSANTFIQRYLKMHATAVHYNMWTLHIFSRHLLSALRARGGFFVSVANI